MGKYLMLSSIVFILSKIFRHNVEVKVCLNLIVLVLNLIWKL